MGQGRRRGGSGRQTCTELALNGDSCSLLPSLPQQSRRHGVESWLESDCSSSSVLRLALLLPLTKPRSSGVFREGKNNVRTIAKKTTGGTKGRKAKIDVFEAAARCVHSLRQAPSVKEIVLRSDCIKSACQQAGRVNRRRKFDARPARMFPSNSLIVSFMLYPFAMASCS